MDIKCTKCGVEYELDEFPLSAEGTEVECGTCAHRFFVQGEEPPKTMAYNAKETPTTPNE